MTKLKINKIVVEVISRPIKYDYEQFGLFLLNGQTYRLLWHDGYVFFFDDVESHLIYDKKLEVMPFMMISNIHYCRIGDYKKFAMVNSENAEMVFDDKKDGRLNDIVFPIIKAKDTDYAIIIDAIKKHEAENAK